MLIVAALSEKRLKELYDYATDLGLEVLVETHNLAELEVAHRLGAQIIGVNNRNLTTFEVDLQTSVDWPNTLRMIASTFPNLLFLQRRMQNE